LSKAQFEPSQTLRQLAEIRDFTLFVTTAFDTMLEAAINTASFFGRWPRPDHQL
jgi:hypothetical protein